MTVKSVMPALYVVVHLYRLREDGPGRRLDELSKVSLLGFLRLQTLKLWYNLVFRKAWQCHHVTDEVMSSAVIPVGLLKTQILDLK